MSTTSSGQVMPSNMIAKMFCFATGNIFNAIMNKFPDTVQVETTNACNSKCIICPHRTMARTISTMDDHIFHKVIDECAQYQCGNVHLHNFGEPLLDKKIVSRVQYAKDKGLQRVKFFSNGSLLTAEIAENLMIAGLDEIKISFDGANKEEFEKIRYPLKFDTVVNNIKNLVAIRNKRQSSLLIEVACSSTSDQSETMESLKNCVDKFSFGKLHNWGDSAITNHGRTMIRKPCSRIWRTFTVLSNGQASLCCLDYEGKVVLGDLHESSIAEIWQNAHYQRMRKYHSQARQHSISICASCSKSFI